MPLKETINTDLKAAMLGGDKFLAETLRGVKSAILNQEIAIGKREEGLGDAEIEQLLAKEAKKRDEAAELYLKGGNEESAIKERKEKEIISKYLPEQMGDDELRKIVEEVAAANPGAQMGVIIGQVKSKVGNAADGGRIAQLVRELGN